MLTLVLVLVLTLVLQWVWWWRFGWVICVGAAWCGAGGTGRVVVVVRVGSRS